MPKTERVNGAVAWGSKRLAGRFHQLRTHRAIPEMDEEHGHGGVWMVPVQASGPGAPPQECNDGSCSRNSLGGGVKEHGKREEPFQTYSQINDAPNRSWTSCAPRRWGAGWDHE